MPRPSDAENAPPPKHRLPPGRPIPLDWQTPYLDHVRHHGHYALAAAVAGISQDTATRERHKNPDFDRACREAREEAADRIEMKMLESAERSDNPVGFIVRLKALRPQEYIERHAVVSMSLSAELPGHDAAALLRAMIANFSDPTRALLAALPDPSAPAPDPSAPAPGPPSPTA